MNPGETIEGKYEILFKLNEGGMGEVYKVRHLLLDEVFVIKKIRAQLMGDENLRQRFHREARTAIRLKHPNIAGIQDFFIDDGGTAHLVMEFIEGVTLKEILERFGPPSLGLTLEMARQTLGALDFLHGRGFLHRDISPDNLMLSRNFNGEPLVKLLDLGLARSMGGGNQLTATGMFLGKARYSPPEQLSGKGTVDETSDLYAFGVTLYELLTGRPPIDGQTFPALIAGHLLRAPRDFAETDPQGKVPEALRRIVLKTLEKEPAQRFSSAEEMLAALETLPPTPWSPEEVQRFDTATLVAKVSAHGTPPESVDETAATELLPRRGAGDEHAAEARTQAIQRIETHLAAREYHLAQTVLLDTAARHGSDERLDALGRQIESHGDPPRRPWLGVAALVLLLGAGALGFYVSRPPAPTALTEQEIDAREAYRLGLEAFEEKDWGHALSNLNRALNLDGQEQIDPTWDDPTWSGRPYLPRFYFGATLAEQGNCVKAFEAFAASKSQAVVQRTPQGEVLEQHFERCEQVTATTREMLRTHLDTARDLAAPLQAALGEESFWRGASGLRTEVEGALADFSELEIRFEAALKRRDYGTLFALEEALLDSQNQLDRLAAELVAP